MDEGVERKPVIEAVAEASVPTKPHRRPFPTIRKWRIRLPRIMVPILLIQYVLRGKIPIDLIPFDKAHGSTLIMGIILIALGGAVRVWARGFHVSGTLFTRGPYAVMRHPLYLGTLLIGVGMCLILNDWVMDVAFLAFFGIIYTATMFSEDSVMREKFGVTHEEYRSRVPALFPVRWNLWTKENLSGWDWRVFRTTTELRSLILILLIPIFLECFEEILDLVY